ncbi:AraC family transcriptional regulator [Luteolibacter ambystomatis]|uniref:AraC family transcriptional regulator n=1 Tax=Luteolibacter ambystomatis TaxID=2824561 RepID=A0A975G9C5_9BACT|nr:AraC family transcriptional regulator [Luteolibacter ambystomatis]QUE51393.1 AraC family transcriptional regulator [Luteolibacter ambystomatis]
MDADHSRQSWLRQLPPGQFRHLFDHLPGTLFFAKDRDGHLMAGNPAFVSRCGFSSEEQMIGITDERIFPPRLAAKYRRDDEKVMESGRPILGIIELFPNSDGKPEWYVTDKLPLYDLNGKVCGVCGTVRSIEAQRAAIQPYLELATVADHLKENFRDKLDVPRLAAMAGLSVRQFERKFRTTFQTTPREYLIRMRVIEACELLARTNLPITDIALESGFYDHSDFARHFLRHMGQSASKYRAERRNLAAADRLSAPNPKAHQITRR